MKRQGLIHVGTLLLISLLFVGLVGFAGCGGGGSSPTAPTEGATLQGQILRESSVQLAQGHEGFTDSLWALLAGREAWASSHQPIPVPNMQVTLIINGQAMGSMMTDGAGRFRFDNMLSGMYTLTMQGYPFSHTMSMGMGQMMAAYGVIWMGGTGLQMNWAHQGGDHWNEMMLGIPAGQWNMGMHQWMM